MIAGSDYKVLSAISLALFLVLAVMDYIILIVFLCAHKRRDKEIELPKSGELTMGAISPCSLFTIPLHVHNCYCSEEIVVINLFGF